MHGNLFVVSRLGQLRNVQTFIRQYGATGNRLAVLYTDANPGLIDVIERNIDQVAFDDVTLVCQPEQPVRQTRRKSRIIFEQIDGLLVKAQEAGVVRVFLCNTDAYYSLFERIIEQRSVPLELNLLEEGLNTYAVAGNKCYERDTSVSWSDVRHRARGCSHALARASRAVVVLLATLVSWVLRVDLFRLRRDLWTRLFVRPLHRYGTITRFNAAYVYFPERIGSANIRVDRVERLDFALAPSLDDSTLAEIGHDAVVFVSQKYLGPEVYTEIVLGILSEMGLERVHFKFHPREDRAAFSRARARVMRTHPRLMVLTLEKIQPVPVEELLMSGRVARIIGLTSTSLMYAKAFFPNVDVVSIASRFKEVAESGEYGIGKRALAEFNRDLEVFLDVSDVAQF